MNQLISPYYYCTQSFTYNNLSFDSGNYYKVYYENGVLKRESLGNCISFNSLDQDDIISQFNIDTSMPDSSVFDDYEYKTTTKITETTISEGTKTTDTTYTWYATGSSSYNVTLTIQNSYYLKLNNKNNGYLTIESNQLSANNNNSAYKFFFLDYDNAYRIQTKGYYENTTITGLNYNSITEANKYYMCVIYNNQLYFVGSHNDSGNDNDRISIVNSIQSALTIRWDSNRFTFENNKNLYLYSSLTGYYRYPVYHNETDKTEITATVQNNLSYTFSKPLNPYFTVNYKDGSSDKINAYAVGYRIFKLENTTMEYEETETTNLLNYNDGNYRYFYYTGTNQTIYDENGNRIDIKPNTILKTYTNYTYPIVSRSRKYRLSGTFYIWSLWYCSDESQYNNFNSGNSEPQYIDGKRIQSVELCYSQGHLSDNATLPTLPDNVTTRTNGEGWDDWTTPLTSTWQFDKIYFIPYLSYVSSVNQTSHPLLEQQAKTYGLIASNPIDQIYKYSGTSGSTLFYHGDLGATSTSYTKDYGYKLQISSGVLAWQSLNKTVSDPSGTTMDSILNTANSHFNDYHYGEYYGKYYGYSGSSLYSELGQYYEGGYVYRIMPNSSNTAFEWVKVKNYTKTDTSDMLLKSGTGVIKVGDIVYGTGTAFASFFSEGWYKVVLDEKTNIVNLVKFNDVGFLTDGSQTYTKLTNDKLVPRSGDYLGYSGTFTIQISAMIRVIENGVVVNEYIKTYKLKFVGSLIS